MSYNALIVQLVNPDTGEPLLGADNKPIRYASPPGYQYVGYAPTIFEVQNWTRYTGAVDSLSSDCVVAPTPDPTAPTWNSGFSLPDASAGQEYSVAIYWDVAGTPALGKTLTGIDWASLPPWLTPSVSPSERKTTLYAVAVPTGITSFSAPLILRQSDNQTAPKTFTPSVGTATVIAYQVYNKVTRTWTIYVGQDGPTPPTIQLIVRPDAYSDGAIYNMVRLPTPFNPLGTPYPFAFSYPAMVTGHYDVKINHLSRVLYASRELVEDVADESVLSLYSTVPTVPPATPFTQVGDPVTIPQVLIDYAWSLTTTTDGYPSQQFEFWVKLDDDSQTVDIKLSKNGGTLHGGTIDHGDYGDGFQNHQYSYEGAPGDVYTVYVRRTGATSDFAVITLPALPSSGLVSRTRIYPA